MDEVGKLEVLTAGVGIKNAHKYGEKYASMYLMKGNIIVDGRNIFDRKQLEDLEFIYEAIGK